MPGVRYPEAEVSVSLFDGDLEELLQTHCPTREVADVLGRNCHRTRYWLEKCGVPRVGFEAYGKTCFFWERKAAEEAVEAYKRKKKLRGEE